MSPALLAMYLREFERVALTVSNQNTALPHLGADIRPAQPEPCSTEQLLRKHTCGPDDGSDAGPWIREPFILTRTERGLSDRRVGDELP